MFPSFCLILIERIVRKIKENFLWGKPTKSHLIISYKSHASVCFSEASTLRIKFFKTVFPWTGKKWQSHSLKLYFPEWEKWHSSQTRRKSWKLQLKMKKQMENTNRTKISFCWIQAHELRTQKLSLLLYSPYTWGGSSGSSWPWGKGGQDGNKNSLN